MNYMTTKNKSRSSSKMKFSEPCGRVRMSTSKKSRQDNTRRANDLLRTISRIKATR